MRELKTLRRVAERLEAPSRLDGPITAVHDALGAIDVPASIRDWLSGTPLGHPAHPFLISAPIGCWTGAAVLDAAKQDRGAQLLVGAGVLCVLPTALTGLSDWLDTAGTEQRVGAVHAGANLAATAAYGASWVARRAGRRRTGIALAVAGALAASAAGWLGGHLAYALGVGVDTNAFDSGPTEWTPLGAAAPSVDDTPQEVSVQSTSLAVVRQGPVVHVLANRCSHRGGPLADGTVEDNCIACPLHGSRFDLRTGQVLQGPASVDQPRYETRSGPTGVEIRRDERRALRRT